MSVLAKEIDQTVFQKRMRNFVELWMPVEFEFIKYFTQYYQNRAGMSGVVTAAITFIL